MRTLAFLAALLVASSAHADEALWKLVQQGGQVLFIRHASTVPGVGDPPGFRIGDCSTQRNLSEDGRAEARGLGEALRERKVPIGAVVSSPWCRCLETARLAFGRVDEKWDALSNLFGRSANAKAQVAALTPRVAGYRGRENLVLVSHGSMLSAFTGVSPQQAEIVVLTPLGERGFRVAGRLGPFR